MTRTRLVPSVIMTLLLTAGVSWGQKAPTAAPAPCPNSTALPYYQQLPQVLFPPMPGSSQCCTGEEECDDGDMVSLLVNDCLKMWALLWQDGKFAEARTMAEEACRFDPDNCAAAYARVLSQLADAPRFVHPAAGCPRSCTAVPAWVNDSFQPFQPSGFAVGLTPAGTLTPDLNTVCAGTQCPKACPSNACGSKSCNAPNAFLNVYSLPNGVTCNVAHSSACGSKPCGAHTAPYQPSNPSATCSTCEEACESCSSKEACACTAKCCKAGNCCCSAKKSCACESKCCSTKDTCACGTKCCQAKSACACDSKCCNAKNAATCCTKCAPAKQSCSCCNNCSCGKSASVSTGDPAGCAFLRMLQGLPSMPGQPPHPVIIMNPMPTPVQPPMPTAFMPPMPHPLMGMGHPGMPMMCPPPRSADMAHDHLFMPVVRPNLPPLSASAVRISEEEMVPPPMLLPSPPPNMPLQITATGKRIKVSCPRFEALCNRVSHLPSGDRILLEGKVRLTYRGNEAGKVSADRVEVDLADGAVEVNPAPAPARPVVPVGYFTPVSRQMPAPTEP